MASQAAFTSRFHYLHFFPYSLLQLTNLQSLSVCKYESNVLELVKNAQRV
jgi:hypothetical protein